MRFATFSRDGDRVEVGLVEPAGGRIRPLAASPAKFEGSMLSLIEGYAALQAAGLDSGPSLNLSQVRLLAPIPTPRRNIFCIGKNYRDHIREFSRSGSDRSGGAAVDDLPEVPIVFTKPPSTVIGPGATIYSHPGVTTSLDYEAELGVVIGRSGRGIAKDKALEHVWGYTIINDVTARDLQRRHVQWFLGKALDSFCPMGPWIVTAEELDHSNLEITCRVNGEVRQHAVTSDMIFDVPTLIAAISAGITLVPGDIIATGTPAGVGAGFKPPRFMGPGDEVTITISGIGTLSNKVG